MRTAARSRVRARTVRERADGTKALADPLGDGVPGQAVLKAGIRKNLRQVGLLLVALLAGQRLCGNDIIGLDPSGGADRETGFCARSEIAGGLVVAAKKGGLCGSQIGLRVISLSAVGHCELGITERRLGPACTRW